MIRTALVTLSVLFLTNLAHAQPAAIPRPYQFNQPIEPRLQWNANSGYCGETSFISAGLRFGQYCSQYTARSIASPRVNQTDPSSQLLLGVNDTAAAASMRLKASEYPNQSQSSTRDFLRWVKSRTLSGNVVIIGVFNNGILLEEWTGRDDGDSEYDHIVPVLRWGSKRPFSDSRYAGDDVITISDNGLYGPFGTPPAYQFYYSFPLNHFTGNRRQANNPNGPVYLLRNRPLNYGIAIEGVLDPEAATVPVSLTPSLNYEPDMPHHSNTPPAPIPLDLTVTVTLPDQSVAYNLYRYDDFVDVPTEDFNANAGQAVETCTIPAGSGASYQFVHSTMTDQTVIFRAVPVTAP